MAVVLLLAAACTRDGDDDDAVTPPDTADAAATTTAAAAEPCSAAVHVAAFDFFGTITMRDDDAPDWIQNPQASPQARPGAAAVASAYLERGYQVLYMSTLPNDVMVGDAIVGDAITSWLDRNNFPIGEGTQLWIWDGSGGVPTISMIDEFVRRTTAGESIDYGYTDNEDKAHSMSSGGVTPEGLFTLGEAARTVAASTPVPDDNMTAHVATVEALGQVCQPG